MSGKDPRVQQMGEGRVYCPFTLIVGNFAPNGMFHVDVPADNIQINMNMQAAMLGTEVCYDE